MPDCLKEMLEAGARLAPVVLLAVFGGVVNYINKPREQFSWWFLLVEIGTAAFAGLVVTLLLQSTSFPPGLKGAVIAVSGYASRDVLYLLRVKVLKEMNGRMS
jgi:hypothetical protein